MVNVGMAVVSTLIANGISVVVEQLDNYIHRLDIAKEKLSNTQSELDTVNSEITETNKKIAELTALDPSSLSITDKEDLQRLKDQNEELRIRQQYLKDQAKYDAGEVAKYAKEKYQKKYSGETTRENIDAYKSTMYSEYDDAYVNTGYSIYENPNFSPSAQAEYESDTLTVLIATLEHLREERQKAIDAQDSEAIEEYNTQIKETEASLRAERLELQGLRDDMEAVGGVEFEDANHRIGMIDNALYTPGQNLVTFINEDIIDNDKNKLVELAESGKLTSDVLKKSFSEVEEYLKNNGLTIEDLVSVLDVYKEEIQEIEEEASKIPSTKTQMIDTINSMADGFDVLDDIYADVLDGGTFDFTKLDTSKFSEAFSEITPEYEKFIETVSASPTDIEACQGAFNDLVSAFIDSKGILEGVDEETKQLTIDMLENMGVVNAEEIVNYALAQSEAEVAAQKILNTNASFDLANATVVEIQELLNEAGQSEETKQKLASLLLQKQLCNQTTIMTDGDIQNLEALAEQAGATASAIATAKQMASDMQTAGAGRLYSNNPEKAKAKYQQIYSSLANDISKQAKLKYTQATNGSLTPKYTGANATADAIEKANKSASDSAKDATEEAKKAYSDWFDFMERRVEVLDDAFANLEKGMENVVGAFAKNSLVDAQLGIVDEEINNYTDALAMYKQQAQNVLSTIEDADLRDKIVNGAVELNQIQGENADVVKSAMEAYQNWSGKIQDCQIKLAELQKELENLELEKFSNIVDDFNDMFDLREYSKDLIDKQIDLIRESGNFVGKSYYQTLVEQSRKQLSLLEEEKAKLVEQMNSALSSGRVKVGSEAWVSMLDHIQEVEESILDVKTNIEELDTELLNLHYEVFEKVQENFDNIGSELENLADLFDDELEIKVSDGNGNWTDEALAQLGLFAQNLELSKYRVAEYGKEIEKLNQDYLDGKYTLLEYQEKLAELSQGQWDAINSAESLEDAIVSLNETRVNEEIETIEDEIDAYEKLIDTQLELIEETEELRKKREDLAEKSKSVTDIERQLAAMQNDDSQATIAKRKLLEEELANAKKDLENAEHEYSVESQKSALEQQLEDYQNARNAEIEQLRLSLENRELLISQSFENVKQNASTVGEQIALIAQEHGIVASNAIISPWTQGENAIASYGETLSVQSSAFIGNIMGVENEVYNLQNEANIASVSLSNMFATRADNLVGQLQSSWYAEDNLNYATNVLQNSLVNTLERGYNISGTMSAMSSIASGMNSVESAARRAAQAIQEALNAQASSKQYYHMGAYTDKNGKTTYYIQDLYSGQKVKESGSYSEISSALDEYKKNNYNFKAYAKGGIVSKEDKGVFDPFAKALGEDTMVAVKYGEGILTQKQTSMLQNFANILPDINQLWNVPDYAVQTPVMQRNDRPNVTINYDKMYEINGDIYDAYQFENKVAKISKNQTTKILNDINRDFRIHSR